LVDVNIEQSLNPLSSEFDLVARNIPLICEGPAPLVLVDLIYSQLVGEGQCCPKQHP
jgi:hypothetical protein